MLRRIEWRSDGYFHTILEAIATETILIVGILALLRYRAQKTTLFLGAGFVGTALLEANHCILTSPWIVSMAPSAAERLAPWSWYAPRLLLGVMMMLGCWFGTIRTERRIPGISLAIFLFVGSTVVAVWCLFALVPMPPAYSTGSVLGRPQEFVPGLLFASALGGLFYRGQWYQEPFFHWAVLSLIFEIAVQFLMMPFSLSLWDTMFDAAHVFKIISYGCVLVGLLVDVGHLFQQVKRANRALDEELAQRKAVEKKLIDRTEQLEAANKELEGFSYSVSHDLRAPLRAIDGFSRILQEDYRSEIGPEARELLDLIIDNTRKMGNLIDDLLKFSRLNRQSVQKIAIDLTQMVETVWRELQNEHDGHEIEFQLQPLPPCEGDPRLLKQVWVNLLANAIKFSRYRQPARIEVGALTQDRKNVYFVRDNGAGFDMKYAHKLFGVFQRLHRHEEYEENGVGLALVQRIVARHGGRIWAEGQPDRGATFYFTLE